MKRAALITCGLLVAFSILVFSESLMKKGAAGGSDVVQESTRRRSGYEISQGGALTFVKTSHGNEIKDPNEGYALAYQLLDKSGRNNIGKPKAIYAIGGKFPCNLLECKKCQKLLNQNQAVASAITTDGVLMITTSFDLDQREDQLRVTRVIVNISNDLEYSQPVKVKVLAAHVQYDHRLTSGAPSQSGIDRFANRTAKPVAVKTSGPISNFLSPGGVFFSPSCEFCPPNCDISLFLSPGERSTVCVDCPGERNSTDTVVEYFEGTVPGGPKCNHPILIDEWGPNGVKAGERKIVCVKCDGSQFSSSVLPSIGLTDSTVKEREGCDVAVTVSRKRVARNEKGLDRNRALLSSANWAPISAGVGNAEYQSDGASVKRYRNGVLPVSELSPGQRFAIISVYNLK